MITAVLSLILCALTPDGGNGPQLPNMSFDQWTGDKLENWGSAAASTKKLGQITVSPEEKFVAVPGSGKKAVKLETKPLKALFGAIKKLGAGSIFLGRTGKVDFSKMSAHIHWGVPFTARPEALEGYACYKPGVIDWAQPPYEKLKGKTDRATISVILADWDQPYDVCPPDQLLDVEKDPGIIGSGLLVLDKEQDGYQKFRIEIKYRNNRVPKYVVIACSSSERGDFFTGSTTSVLYVDEFRFVY